MVDLEFVMLRKECLLFLHYEYKEESFLLFSDLKKFYNN